MWKSLNSDIALFTVPAFSISSSLPHAHQNERPKWKRGTYRTTGKDSTTDDSLKLSLFKVICRQFGPITVISCIGTCLAELHKRYQ